ncbi:hypothetical protein TKK_0003477 [Trichogramma kaykai]
MDPDDPAQRPLPVRLNKVVGNILPREGFPDLKVSTVEMSHVITPNFGRVACATTESLECPKQAVSRQITDQFKVDQLRRQVDEDRNPGLGCSLTFLRREDHEWARIIRTSALEQLTRRAG